MDKFSEGLAFLIRILALLFVWLVILLYISPELAALIGLGVIGLWLVFFLPLAAFQHLTQPKMADLPPLPPASSPEMPPAPAYSPLEPDILPTEAHAVDLLPPTGGQLVVGETGQQIQLPDYLPEYPAEELPPHPYYEPPPRRSIFWRSLVLPLAGILMIFGVYEHEALEGALISHGLRAPAAIAWDKLSAPESHREEQYAAARLALRREGVCESIVGGKVAPANQLNPKDLSTYVYEFNCQNRRFGERIFPVWVAPEDIPGMPWPTYTTFTAHPIDMKIAEENCEKSLGTLLKPLNMAADPTVEDKFEAYTSNVPFRGYLRAYLEQEFIKGSGQRVLIRAVCWISPTGETIARLNNASK